MMLAEQGSMTIDDAFQHGYLALANLESPEIDSRILLCQIIDCQTTYLHTWPDKLLTQAQQEKFKHLITQRQKGHPIAYLIGRRGFWTLDLKVTTDTLIPRSDTELLVSLALTKLKPEMSVVDLGTGTGAIALSLAIETPTATIVAMDYSRSVLDVAIYNAKSNNINNIAFWQGSWLTAIAENSLDLIVSNPPYIENNDPHLSQGDVRFEPINALRSGADGLDDIRNIIKQARYSLKSASYLLLEHGSQQAKHVRELFDNTGFINVTTHQDLGGNDRVTMGQVV